jgi:hypothetical protein
MSGAVPPKRDVNLRGGIVKVFAVLGFCAVLDVT